MFVRAGVEGGLLFENFLATCGTRGSRRAILALAKTCGDQKRECTADEAARLISSERVGFFAHILAALSNRGRAANRQLFYFTLLAQARGLSRTGMEVLQALSACLAPRTFDLELVSFLGQVTERRRSLLSHKLEAPS